MSDRPEAPPDPSVRHAAHVAAGILASRVLGLVRQKVFLHYLGASAAADAFNAAFRIPNALQNLLGEGVLSASFIPAYARLRAEGDEEGRRALAGAVLGLLVLVVSILVLLGVLAAPWIVDLVAMGFSQGQRELTVRLVRVLFPGAGVFVVSAWCLGVLNSHGRFLLSYASAAAWNLAMIGALLLGGGRRAPDALVVWLAWGSVIGGLLQVAVQWPSVHGVLGAWRISLGRRVPHARTVIRAMVPAVMGRGAVQLSAYVDSFIASWLVTGSLTILSNAQALYMLPVSLFGMSISAAELPALAGDAAAGSDAHARVRARLGRSLGRLAFLVVPSAMALVTIGDALGTLLFAGGRFGREEVEWLWATLAAAGAGLYATTVGRLYASTLYALRDPVSPQRIAVVRVTLGAALGALGALWGAARLGLAPAWSVAFLALGSSIAGWVEFVLLRRKVVALAGTPDSTGHAAGRVVLAATLAAGATALLRVRGLDLGGRAGAAVAIASFAVIYVLATLALGVPEARAMRDGLRRRT